MKKRMSKMLALGLAVTMVGSNVVCVSAEEAAAGGEKWTQEEMADGWVKVTNEGGETLGYSKDSGVTILEQDGYAFKDLNQNGELDVYEDWRQDDQTRAQDLASKMSGEEIAPLLTHGGWMSFGEELSEADEEYFAAGGRAGVTRAAYSEGNTETAVKWTNMLQSRAEAEGGYGIPVTISTDPTNISNIIDQNALASAMDMTLANEVAQEVSKEYRAVGITMVLGPQIDIATTNQWVRTSGAYSEDPALTRDLANAVVSGMQSTYDEEGNDLGWGKDSVVNIVKHFAGAGSAEGGRNDHNDNGKYTVYPGNNFAAHLVSFFDGAFNLDSATGKAGGVMPNYGISWSEDGSLGEEVGGAYSEFKMDLLRDNGYDGFVLTDWQITEDPDGEFGSRAFGAEDMTGGERFAKLFENGVDQVGGTTDVEAALEGYEIMKEDLGEEEALANMREHAARFFVTQMQVGLFENAYLNTEESVAAVWTEETKAYGRSTQEKTVIMLKNSENTIAQAAESAEKATIYVPYKYTAASQSFMGSTPASVEPVMDIDLVSQYFNVVTDSVGEPSGTDEEGNPAYVAEDIVRASAEELANCNYALVTMTNPLTESTSDEDGIYYPASMQFEEYTAETAHEAIANGTEIVEISDGYYGTTTQEVEEDRSYTGESVGKAENYAEYETLQYVNENVPETRKVIVTMSVDSVGGLVWSEVEPLADAILMYYAGTSFDGTSYFQDDVLLDVISGKIEPTGLLPCQQPASMEAVEAQQEDVPRDVECYVDADGNTYDFTFGLNWSGKIEDERVATYNVAALTTPESITYTAGAADADAEAEDAGAEAETEAAEAEGAEAADAEAAE